jgi:heme-degrading monooxygenase HmoA
MRAYAALRARLEEGIPGLLGHELTQNVDDPRRWIITSE